jgi:hypothetical protein
MGGHLNSRSLHTALATEFWHQRIYTVLKFSTELCKIMAVEEFKKWQHREIFSKYVHDGVRERSVFYYTLKYRVDCYILANSF